VTVNFVWFTFISTSAVRIFARIFVAAFNVFSVISLPSFCLFPFSCGNAVVRIVVGVRVIGVICVSGLVLIW